jgi:hypothetical protein
MNLGDVFDCNCVATRPKQSRLYGARWRVYLNMNSLNLRCLDCGRVHTFQLMRRGVQVVRYSEVDLVGEGCEVSAVVQETKTFAVTVDL